MLTTDQKETILRKAGVAVPAVPSRDPSEHQQQADAAPIVKENMQADGQQNMVDQWARTIDALFVDYSTARAARSLRDAEEVRRQDAMRQASGSSTA